MAATIKHKMKVTDTEIPTAAATLALSVPCPGAVVPTGNKKKTIFVLIFSKFQEECKIRTSKTWT